MEEKQLDFEEEDSNIGPEKIDINLQEKEETTKPKDSDDEQLADAIKKF